MIIGQKPTEKLGHTDAIHVPVVVVTSDYLLEAGAWVKFVKPGYVEVCDKDEAHGMIDPFSNPFNRAILLLNPKYAGEIAHHFDLNIDLEEEDEDDSWNDGCRGCNS